MGDIMKIIHALKNSNILLKGVTKTIKNNVNKQKGGALGMLLGTLGASLLGNLLTGRGFVRAGKGNIRAEKGNISAGETFVRAGDGIKKKL